MDSEDEDIMDNFDYSGLLSDDSFEAEVPTRSLLEPEDACFDNEEEFLKCISRPAKTFTHQVEGIEILFPYKPYFSQEQMMNALIKVAQDSKHALLESPTGTGKTAALLCGLLGWLKYHDEELAAMRSMTTDPWDEMLNSDEDEEVSAAYDSFVSNSPMVIPETPSALKNQHQQFQNGVHDQTTQRLQSPATASNAGDTSYTQITQVPSPALIKTPSRPSSRYSIQSPVSPLPGPSRCCNNSVSTPCSSKSKGPSVATKRPRPWQTAATQLVSTPAKEDSTPMGLKGPKMPHTSFSEAAKYDGEDIASLRIIYATRTHSQIAQVVRQLKDTHYARTPMTVLGSRKHCCINPIARDPSQFGLALQGTVSIDEACTIMRKEYYRSLRENERDTQLNGSDSDNEVHMASQPQVPEPSRSRTSQQTQSMSQKNTTQLVSSWANEKTWSPCKFFQSDLSFEADDIMSSRDKVAVDIEDIRRAGQERQTCPYYVLNELRKSAKLVICTYDHLLHFGIRKACQLDLPNAILVFDEAHNIEDKCRDIASMKLNLREVVNVGKNLQELSVPASRQQPHGLLISGIISLLGWMEDEAKGNAAGYIFDDSESTDSDEAVYKNVTNTIVVEFKEIGWGPDELKELWSAYFAMLKEDTENRYVPPMELLKSYARILHVVHYLYKSCKTDESTKQLCIQDYDVFIQKSRKKIRHRQASMKFLTTAKTDEVNFGELKLSVLCLNPAVAFEELKQARSIIVASGTLSPIDSFSSELNVDFECQDSLPHVLGKERVFPAIVSKLSPSSENLKFSYSHLHENFAQVAKDLSQVIQRICAVVPKGVLVFVSSKTQLVRFRDFWAKNGQIAAFSQYKKLYYETDAEKPEDFLTMMSNYKQDARSTGALLFAILRGKVSEGVDFKDDEARAVIAVGIPFAPCREKSILAKQVYNDLKNLENDSYLNGKAWYQGQAFRALNQALGRCIRHAQDWGLVFVVDCRFAQVPEYRRALPGWIMKAYNAKIGYDLDSILKHAEKFIDNVQKLQ